MIASEDYNQLAQRCAQLAIACSTPSIAGALTMLALNYLEQSHRLGPSQAVEQERHQMQHDPSAGFGD